MNARHITVLYIVAPIVSFAVNAFGQSVMDGDGHAQNHHWYKDLQQPGTGLLCCNGTANGRDGDCRPTRAYLDDDGTWKALIDGRWVAVPPKVVLKHLAPDGNSHICANKWGDIFCFIGGSPKG